MRHRVILNICIKQFALSPLSTELENYSTRLISVGPVRSWTKSYEMFGTGTLILLFTFQAVTFGKIKVEFLKEVLGAMAKTSTLFPYDFVIITDHDQAEG